LDYGSIIFNTASKTDIHKLNVIRNYALRLCIGAFCTSPIQKIMEEVGIDSLQARRDHLALKYYVKLAENPQHPNYFKTFHSNLEKIYSTYKPFGKRTRELIQAFGMDTNDISSLKMKIQEHKLISPPNKTAYRHNRKEETTLARIRIGHTAFTHKPLFTSKSLNLCPKCKDEHITIQHILDSCLQYSKQKVDILGPDFKYVDTKLDNEEMCQKLFKFLQNTNLFNDI